MVANPNESRSELQALKDAAHGYVPRNNEAAKTKLSLGVGEGVGRGVYLYVLEMGGSKEQLLV